MAISARVKAAQFCDASDWRFSQTNFKNNILAIVHFSFLFLPISPSAQTDEAAAAAAAGGPATPQFKSHAVRLRPVTTEPDLVQRSEAFRYFASISWFRERQSRQAFQQMIGFPETNFRVVMIPVVFFSKPHVH